MQEEEEELRRRLELREVRLQRLAEAKWSAELNSDTAFLTDQDIPKKEIASYK